MVFDPDDSDLEESDSGPLKPISGFFSEHIEIEVSDTAVTDEFNEADFDHDFDDDFEEEVDGEYDLEDDQYGEEFRKEFGHLTSDEETDFSDEEVE